MDSSAEVINTEVPRESFFDRFVAMRENHNGNRFSINLSNRQSLGIVLAILLVGTLSFFGGRKWDERDYRSEEIYQLAKQNALDECAKFGDLYT